LARLSKPKTPAIESNPYQPPKLRREGRLARIACGTLPSGTSWAATNIETSKILPGKASIPCRKMNVAQLHRKICRFLPARVI
jgi:hypothetical protein